MESHGTDIAPASDGATSTADDQRHEPAALLRPGWILSRWSYIFAGVVLLLVGIALVMWRINVAYFAVSPGPVSDVGDYVTVEGGREEDGGELLLLTVSLKEVTALEAVAAWLIPEIDLVPTESIRPAGVTSEELRQQNFDAMALSQQTAIAVALEHAGYEVTLKGHGALVTAVIIGGAAEEKLEAGDVIVAVNGAAIEFSGDAVSALSEFKPQEMVTLKVLRTSGESAMEFEVQVVLGVFRGIDENGREVVDPDRGMVGVLLGNFNVETVLPLGVEIDSDNIGGPSAGMMLALEIIDQLHEGDLIRGRIVAGTGTLDRDGTVGEVGGIRQKIFAAVAAGAEFVLVPTENFADAVGAAGKEIKVVGVENIGAALDFFDTF